MANICHPELLRWFEMVAEGKTRDSEPPLDGHHFGASGRNFFYQHRLVLVRSN